MEYNMDGSQKEKIVGIDDVFTSISLAAAAIKGVYDLGVILYPMIKPKVIELRTWLTKLIDNMEDKESLSNVKSLTATINDFVQTNTL
jgi:hypothetical protein